MRSGPFATAFELSGDTLTRAPRGFDSEHPLVDDLKRKDFIGVRVLDENTATSERFLHSFLSMSRDGVPLFAQPGVVPEAGLTQLVDRVRELDVDEVRREIAEREQERAGSAS